MKRLLVVILSILYFTASSGATVHLQYCMGKLVRVSLSVDESEDCDHCGMKKKVCKKKCCKEEKKVFKTSDQNSQSHIDLAFVAKILVALPSYFSYPHAETAFEQVSRNMYLAHAPPSVWRSCPIYVQVQNFRI